MSNYRTQPDLVSDENAFQPAEVGALLLTVAMIVVAVAFVPATGWTHFREVAPFLGSAFGAIIAIYGAHKVTRIKEIRDRRHAREELLDIVSRATWDFENDVCRRAMRSPWMPANMPCLSKAEFET